MLPFTIPGKFWIIQKSHRVRQTSWRCPTLKFSPPSATCKKVYSPLCALAIRALPTWCRRPAGKDSTRGPRWAIRRAAHIWGRNFVMAKWPGFPCGSVFVNVQCACIWISTQTSESGYFSRGSRFNLRLPENKTGSCGKWLLSSIDPLNANLSQELFMMVESTWTDLW